jgi:hypothetical protein
MSEWLKCLTVCGASFFLVIQPTSANEIKQIINVAISVAQNEGGIWRYASADLGKA